MAIIKINNIDVVMTVYKLESLKAFRRERGISVEKLARQLDLSSTYVSQIENGHAAPALGFMRKLKAAYPEIDVNMFFTDKVKQSEEVSLDDNVDAD